MLSLILSACIALFIAALCIPLGIIFRKLVLGSDSKEIEALDLPLGYSITSIILIFSLRIDLGITTGIILAATSLAFASTASKWRQIHLPRMSKITIWIIASFSIAILAAYFPLLWDHGSIFHYPEIFDAPKHILAITALQSSKSWPPQNPFMPGLDFAYNFGFYAIPSAVISLIGDARLCVPILPWIAVISAISTLTLTLSIATRIGTQQSLMPIVAIAATWLGGFTPLLVDTYPALGFRMHTEGLIAGKIWTDEPFVSAIFVPQHLFAATCVLSIIRLSLCLGAVWRRTVAAATISLAGSLSSLILLPHINAIFAATVAIMLFRERSRKEFVRTAIIILLYCAALLPFIHEAAEWQSGEGEPIFGRPQDLKTIGFLLLATGPTSVLAFFAFWRGRQDRAPAFLCIGTAILVAFFGAIVFQYSEAPLKSTLLLRAILPTLAGIGFAFIWKKLTYRWAQASFALALCLCIIINLPTMWFFAAAPLRPYAETDRSLIQALQKSEPPIVFDDTSNQWLAALSAKQTILDFRPIRTDAYLPPKDRPPYARFFDNKDHSIIDLSAIKTVIHPAGKPSSFVSGGAWKSDIDAMGLTLAERRP